MVDWIGLQAVRDALLADAPAVEEPLLDQEAPEETRPALIASPRRDPLVVVQGVAHRCVQAEVDPRLDWEAERLDVECGRQPADGVGLQCRGLPRAIHDADPRGQVCAKAGRRGTVCEAKRTAVSASTPSS